MAEPEKIGLRVSNALSNYGTIAILICLTGTFAVAKPHEFLTVKNGFIMLQQIALLGLVALGVTFLLAMRYYDLSIGYVVSLSGVVATRSVFSSLGYGAPQPGIEPATPNFRPAALSRSAATPSFWSDNLRTSAHHLNVE